MFESGYEDVSRNILNWIILSSGELLEFNPYSVNWNKKIKINVTIDCQTQNNRKIFSFVLIFKKKNYFTSMARRHGGDIMLKKISTLWKLLENCKKRVFSWPHKKSMHERPKAQTSEYHRCFVWEVLNRYINQIETCILALLS